ncbi:MAG: hypothetical protein EBX71_05775, partial [Betaproteobacteria bacterium]|nr:hypothetical protein [Betaproteobacteria bacterium]
YKKKECDSDIDNNSASLLTVEGGFAALAADLLADSPCAAADLVLEVFVAMALWCFQMEKG